MYIIICGVVKNCATAIDKSIELSRQLGEKSGGDYKIIIYENNSTDGTKDVLSKYINDIDCKIIMEDIPEDFIKANSKIWAYTEITGSDHPCRIEQIANARNNLINEIIKPTYDADSIIVMIDLDSSNWDINGILNSIEHVRNNKKLVLYGNSFPYYDYYALRHYNTQLFGPEVIGEIFWNRNKNIVCNNDFAPVYSAFNGIGVFNREAFLISNYDALLSSNIVETYDKLIKQHTDVYNEYKNYITTPCSKFPGGVLENGILYKNNSGYDKPVICEHVSFNFKLLNNGYNIYINPNMIYSWGN
jgi:hypothetical protein